MFIYERQSTEESNAASNIIEKKTRRFLRSAPPGTARQHCSASARSAKAHGTRFAMYALAVQKVLTIGNCLPKSTSDIFSSVRRSQNQSRHEVIDPPKHEIIHSVQNKPVT